VEGDTVNFGWGVTPREEPVGMHLTSKVRKETKKKKDSAQKGGSIVTREGFREKNDEKPND